MINTGLKQPHTLITHKPRRIKPLCLLNNHKDLITYIIVIMQLLHPLISNSNLLKLLANNNRNLNITQLLPTIT